MTDREKVIKGLELCIEKHQCCMESPEQHCPYEHWLGEYEDSFYECTSMLAKDALALLKEQEKVVRCKDCRRHYNELKCPCGGYSPDDWFCAAGERKDGE